MTNFGTLSVYGGFTVTAAQAIDVTGSLVVGGSAATIDNTTLDLGAAGTFGVLNLDEGTALTLGRDFSSAMTVDVADGQIMGFACSTTRQ